MDIHLLRVVFANYFCLYTSIFNFGLLKREKFLGSFFFGKEESHKSQNKTLFFVGAYAELKDIPRRQLWTRGSSGLGDRLVLSFCTGSVALLASIY